MAVVKGKPSAVFHPASHHLVSWITSSLLAWSYPDPTLKVMVLSVSAREHIIFLSTQQHVHNDVLDHVMVAAIGCSHHPLADCTPAGLYNAGAMLRLPPSVCRVLLQAEWHGPVLPPPTVLPPHRKDCQCRSVAGNAALHTVVCIAHYQYSIGLPSVKLCKCITPCPFCYSLATLSFVLANRADKCFVVHWTFLQLYSTWQFLQCICTVCAVYRLYRPVPCTVYLYCLCYV